MYASANTDLHSATTAGEVVCQKNDRVVLVYPMVADPDTGIIFMKVKQVDAHTSQLTWHWVNVYDPNSDTRYVSQFSLLP